MFSVKGSLEFCLTSRHSIVTNLTNITAGSTNNCLPKGVCALPHKRVDSLEGQSKSKCGCSKGPNPQARTQLPKGPRNKRLPFWRNGPNRGNQKSIRFGQASNGTQEASRPIQRFGRKSCRTSEARSAAVSVAPRSLTRCRLRGSCCGWTKSVSRPSRFERLE